MYIMYNPLSNDDDDDDNDEDQDVDDGGDNDAVDRKGRNHRHGQLMLMGIELQLVDSSFAIGGVRLRRV